VQELLTGEQACKFQTMGPRQGYRLFLRGTDADRCWCWSTASNSRPLRSARRPSSTCRSKRLTASKLSGVPARASMAQRRRRVIQIFTRRGQGEPQLTASAGGGSHNTENTSAGLSGSSSRLSYSVSSSYLGSDGYVSCRGTPVPPGGGCFTFDFTPDGFHNARSPLGSDTTSATRRTSRSQHCVPGWDPLRRDVRQSRKLRPADCGGTGRWSPLPSLHLTIRAGQSRMRRRMTSIWSAEQVRHPSFPGTLQADWQLAPQQLLTLGTMRSAIAWRVRSLCGQFTPRRRRLPRVSRRFASERFSISARHDDNEQFGGQATGSAAWSHRFAGGRRLTASFGTGFRAPTFNELYYPFFGNPALRPEHSRSAELGIDGSRGEAQWSLHTFETRVNDLIAFDSSFLPANIETAVIRGAEGQVTARRGRRRRH